MAWTIPDKGEASSDISSILFQEYVDVLIEGQRGVNCVISGLKVTAQGTPDMTVAVASGAVISNGAIFRVTGANGTITTADATNPRIDLVVITSAGAIAVRAGTAAVGPKPPARTANDVVLAAVFVPANDTTIATNQIVDLRVIKDSFGISLAANATANATTTGVQITGLECPLQVGNYTFKYTIRYQSAATTTGVQFAVNFDGTAAVFVASMRLLESTTAASSGAATQAGYSATTLRLVSGSSTRTKATTAPNLGASISVDAATSDMLCHIEGMLIVTAAGNLELWHASEVAFSSTVMAGTSLVVEKTG